MELDKSLDEARVKDFNISPRQFIVSDYFDVDKKLIAVYPYLMANHPRAASYIDSLLASVLRFKMDELGEIKGIFNNLLYVQDKPRDSFVPQLKKQLVATIIM